MFSLYPKLFNVIPIYFLERHSTFSNIAALSTTSLITCLAGSQAPAMRLAQITPAVRAVFKDPPPTKLTLLTRNTLLPYLALGFTPISTSGGDNLCGLHALAESLKHARDALQHPAEKKIRSKEHLTVEDFQKMLASKAYEKLMKVYVKEIYGLEDGKAYKAEMAYLTQPKNMNAGQLEILLQLANNRLGTDFQLGTITRGYRYRWDENSDSWDTEYFVHTAPVIYGEPNNRPTIWLYNDNSEAVTVARGFRGEDVAVSHWEAFGPYEKNNGNYRDRVKRWNLGGLMREDIARGVWRVIEYQDGMDEGQLLNVDVGAFLHEAEPPSGAENIREGFKWMGTVDNEHFGLVPEESILKIELHHSAPEAVENGTKVVVDLDPSPDATPKEKTAPAPPTISHTSRSSRGVQFFRGIRPTDRTGGYLEDDELPLYEREGFDFKDGDFLLDLNLREKHWYRVRLMNGKEGWAHARRLQALEKPWGLPDEMSFPITTDPLDVTWNVEQIVHQARFRHIEVTNASDPEVLMVEISLWESDRTEHLPIYKVEPPRNNNDSQPSSKADPKPSQKDGEDEATECQFLPGEIVLNTEVVEKDGKLEVMGFDREIGMVEKAGLQRIPGIPWGIMMSKEDLNALLGKAKDASTAPEHRPRSPKRAVDKANDEKENQSTTRSKRRKKKDD